MSRRGDNWSELSIAKLRVEVENSPIEKIYNLDSRYLCKQRLHSSMAESSSSESEEELETTVTGVTGRTRERQRRAASVEGIDTGSEETEPGRFAFLQGLFSPTSGRRIEDTGILDPDTGLDITAVAAGAVCMFLCILNVSFMLHYEGYKTKVK